MSGDKQSSSGLDFQLHPLVLININDHHIRTKANTPAGNAGGSNGSNLTGSGSPSKVLGILLGVQSGRTVDISNSFEIKYQLVDGSVVIDDGFLLHKQEQYKQVFSKIDVVGWYSTGSEVQEVDLQIHKKVMALNESPVFLLLNPRVDHSRKNLPVTLFETELHLVEGTPTFIFVTSNYTVETSDAERIGVDQVAKIMPSGKASGSEQLSAHLVGVHSAMKMLVERLRLIQGVVAQVEAGEIPFPHSLLRSVSSLVNSLPAMETQDFKKNYDTEVADSMLPVYLSSLTAGVTLASEGVDKALIAFERSGMRGTGGRRGLVL
ncbi:MAG: hypothetical protein WDW36_001089 [Sanguina aurantia]